MASGTQVMNMQCSPAPENVRIGQGTLFLREVNTIIAALIIATVTYIFAFCGPIAEQNINELVPKFVGVAWPFFALVLALVFYVVGATIVAAFALGALDSGADKPSSLLGYRSARS